MVRVARQKGLRGLRDGVGWWAAQERAVADIAPPPVPGEEGSPAIPWFLRPDGPYAAWARENVDPSAPRLAALRTAAERAHPSGPPRFSVVLLPTCGDESVRDASLDSVRGQAYPPGCITAVLSPTTNGEDADWVAFLREGDRLAPGALAEVALAAAARPEADLFYSDEDCLLPDGTPVAPAFKPEFSSDLLDATPYACRLMVVRRDAFLRLGGLSGGEDLAAAEYDLALRAAEAGLVFVRIPKVLYRRAVETVDDVTPSLLASDAAARAHRAGREALVRSLARRGESAAVVRDGETAGTFRISYPLPEPRPLVSILVPFRDRPDLLRVCAESILARTTYAPYELLLVDNGSETPETARLLARLASAFPDCVRVVRHDAPFNYSAINNAAAREARGDYLVLLNNDTEVITGDWLEQMLCHCARPGVGAVGATLLYPDDTIQHAGVVLGLTGLAGHAWAGLRDAEVPGGWHRHARDVTAVTAACLMTPRAVWDALGGLDERFVVCGNDVDYCLRCARRAGLRVLHAPAARLYHYETQSRDAAKVLPQDLDMSALSYGPLLGRTDRYFSPNLTVATTRATLRLPGEPGEPEPPRPSGVVPAPLHPSHVACPDAVREASAVS